MPDTSNQNVDQSPPEPPTSTVEDYESRRRVEIAHVMHRIDTDVFVFGGAHFLTWMFTCLGFAISADHGLASMALEHVGFAILAAAVLGWLVNFAFAIDAIAQGLKNVTRLRWTQLLLAALPWAVLAFEAAVVLAGMG